MKENMETDVLGREQQIPNEPVSNDVGVLGESLTHENPYELQEKIRELRERLEMEKETLKAVDNSTKIYGDAGFVASIDGVEVTPELVMKNEQELEALQQREKELRYHRRRKLLSSLRSFFLSF